MRRSDTATRFRAARVVPCDRWTSRLLHNSCGRVALWHSSTFQHSARGISARKGERATHRSREGNKSKRQRDESLIHCHMVEQALSFDAAKRFQAAPSMRKSRKVTSCHFCPNTATWRHSSRPNKTKKKSCRAARSSTKSCRVTLAPVSWSRQTGTEAGSTLLLQRSMRQSPLCCSSIDGHSRVPKVTCYGWCSSTMPGAFPCVRRTALPTAAEKAINPKGSATRA